MSCRMPKEKFTGGAAMKVAAITPRAAAAVGVGLAAVGQVAVGTVDDVPSDMSISHHPSAISQQLKADS